MLSVLGLASQLGYMGLAGTPTFLYVVHSDLFLNLRPFHICATIFSLFCLFLSFSRSFFPLPSPDAFTIKGK